MARRIASRYAQVALTYTRPWYMRMWAAFIGWFIIASLVFSRAADYGGQIAYLLIGGTIAAWGGAIVAGHTKEQLADARARLTPHFRGPHLVVAALVFLVGAVVFSLFIVAHRQHAAIASGWPKIPLSYSGFLAAVLLAAAAMAWSTHLQSAVFIFGSIIAGMIFVTPHGQALLMTVLTGGSLALAWATIAASTAALLALGWRQAALHEEMREYWTVEGIRAGHRIQSTGDQRYRRVAAAETGAFNAFLRGADRLEDVRNIFAAGFWPRVRHWRRASGMSRLGWLAGGMFLPFLLYLSWFEGGASRDDQNFLLIVMPGLLSMTMPVLFTATLWPEQWNVMRVAFLRPVASRARFVGEQGTAMACDLATTWASVTLGVFATTLIMRPAAMISPTVAAILLFSAAGQVWFFGVAVWVLRLRNQRWVAFIAFFGSLMLMGILLARQMDGRRGMINMPSPLIAGLIALAGLLIAADAYRRWLRTDLD
jgi:hypothetical protein